MNTNTLLFGERRQFIRKECFRMVSINDQVNTYAGYLRDLALGGAYMELHKGILPKIGQELILSIPFGLRHESVSVNAIVARIEDNGIGVRFYHPDSHRRTYA